MVGLCDGAPYVHFFFSLCLLYFVVPFSGQSAGLWEGAHQLSWTNLIHVIYSPCVKGMQNK